MLELLLLRHAKSSWEVEGLADYNRDLTPRGEKAASAIGKLIKKEKCLPDLVLCSTALRAKRSLELAAQRWPDDLETRWLKSIYLAAPSRLFEIVRRQAPAAQRLMLVGHNPGMHNFALQLVGRGKKKALGRLEAKLPTGALARIGFACESWSEVAPKSGRLLELVWPRDLD